MTGADDDGDLTTVLAQYLPFRSVDQDVRTRLAAEATIETYAAGDLVLDAFADPSSCVYIVLDGRVGMWNDAGRLDEEPDEVLGRGGVFGFSAMLTERSIGPRVVAITEARVARIPGGEATAAFVTRDGARFLARSLAKSLGQPDVGLPAYGRVGDLVTSAPIVVDPSVPADEVARRMTQAGRRCAVVETAPGAYAAITDASLRRRLLAEGRPVTAPAGEVVAAVTPRVAPDESAAEALLALLDAEADAAVVTDDENRLIGVVTMREISLTPTAADVAIHQRLRRAPTPGDLVDCARQFPDLLGRLLEQGLGSGRVIGVYSTLLDALVRRALELEYARHPDLSMSAFTWLALGSNGRREAVLSSDIDSAVSFADGTPEEVMARHREALAGVDRILQATGLATDKHGVSGRHTILSRTHEQWREAAREWLADPVAGKGAIMTSLLVDARPLAGTDETAAADLVVAELREHPLTMRLLLTDALARRARLRSLMLREPWRRTWTYDIKEHALLPLVNLARWAALVAGSNALSTRQRLLDAGGSTVLSQEQAGSLAEVFEVLQRLRLRYQLMQWRDGVAPSDSLVFEAMSPIDRSVVAQAVREIAQAQKRFATVTAYTDAAEWVPAGDR